MAIFRKLHVSFWEDEFIETLTPEQKFFYLYLLTNHRTSQCGIYEVTIRQMSFDTGYNNETISNLINIFVDKGKIRYNQATKEIALKNWGKYNDSSSPKVKACIKKELKDVKDLSLIQYVYSMDTVSGEVGTTIDTHTQEEKEEEQYKEEDKNAEKLIAPQIVQAFKETFPKYPVDKQKDFPAALQIAQKIADSNGWNQNDILKDKKQDAVNQWKGIIAKISGDKWFSTRSISDLNNEWQRLIQFINNGHTKPPQNSTDTHIDITGGRKDLTKRYLP